MNAVENLVPFAAVVLVANAARISTSVTVACAAIYFYSRVAHAVVHISGTGLFKCWQARGPERLVCRTDLANR